jgi:hypothetical protein
VSGAYLLSLSYIALMVAVPAGVVLGVFFVGVIDLVRARQRRL